MGKNKPPVRLAKKQDHDKARAEYLKSKAQREFEKSEKESKEKIKAREKAEKEASKMNEEAMFKVFMQRLEKGEVDLDKFHHALRGDKDDGLDDSSSNDGARSE
jgi:hypothetical protein